ncbi:MAG: YiiD C-terminal domain-containing protein [Pseudoxanthomonas sp.]
MNDVLAEAEPTQAALRHLRELCARIAPVVAMQVEVDSFDGQRLQLRAPLAANINDKGNAFGGSLVSLMTLAGWGLVNLQLHLRGIDAEVYVADSQVRYRAPLYDDLCAVAYLAEGESWEVFFDTLAKRGRARLQMETGIPLAEGGVATEMSARFVAIMKGG